MQQRKRALVGLCCAFVVAVTGCAYVKVQPNAREVEVLSAERTAECKKLGQTKVSVAEKILFVPRGEPAVRKDLEILARNSAADMGGDTITPLTEVREGRQTFGVYDCLGD